LAAGVAGLGAQSTKMSTISDNIANVNTVGYKGTTVRFSTLVTTAATDTSYSPGGVQSNPFALIAEQGLIQASSTPTDIAIAGEGFFVVNAQADSSGEPIYTRAGSFREDNVGNLRNTAGFYLQGWPLDNQGLLPGAPGNITNTTSAADISSLETINVRGINGVAATTTGVSVGINLQAGQAISTGPQDTSLLLGVTAATDLALTDGDQFTLTSGANVLTVEYDPTPAGGIEFSSLNELAALINADANFSATVGGTAGDATITVTSIDPTNDLVIDDVGAGTAATTLFGAMPATTTQTYDATDVTKNMASGSVTPDFSRSVRVFDAQGSGHDLSIAFLKIGVNTWAAEVFAVPASEATAIAPNVNSQIGSGTVTFNGDATLNGISTGLVGPLSVSWTNGSSPSTITFDWGSSGPLGTGLADGLSQFDSDYDVAFVNQNGSEVGELNGVTIDDEGFVVASFNNGQTTRLYKIPIATFGDVSQLSGRTGNVYAQSEASGQFNLREAGKGGAGLIAPSALEASNVDLAEEFTTMIITQRAFSAASQVITTVDDMLEELSLIRR
jgi:flagellar hook protein FlgE